MAFEKISNAVAIPEEMGRSLLKSWESGAEHTKTDDFICFLNNVPDIIV